MDSGWCSTKYAPEFDGVGCEARAAAAAAAAAGRNSQRDFCAVSLDALRQVRARSLRKFIRIALLF
jgi:hypothetical protein